MPNPITKCLDLSMRGWDKKVVSVGIALYSGSLKYRLV